MTRFTHRRQERQEPRSSSYSWTRGWMTDSAQLLVSQISTAVATASAAILIARTLGPSDWGVFSAFLGLSIAVTLIADFGIGTWLLRELSRLFADGQFEPDAHEASRLVSSGILINLAIALPLLAAAAAWCAFAQPDIGVAIALLSLLVYAACTSVANALESHQRALRRVRVVLSATLLEKGLLIVLIAVTALADGGVGAIGLSYLCAGLSRVAFDCFVVFVLSGLPLIRVAARELRERAHQSMPFALNAAALNLIPRLDTLVLLTMSTTSAAWFAVGERALGPALLVPATFGIALFPFMARDAARQLAPWKLALGFGLLGAGIACVGIALTPWLVPLLFGDAYTDAVGAVRIMLVVIPFVYATSPLLVVAYSNGRERALLLPGLTVSCIGTLAIVAGQATGGTTFVAVAFVLRSALFLGATAAVALAPRNEREEAARANRPARADVGAHAP